MAGNIFGHLLRLTTYGESHGDSIGGILGGVPPNMPVDVSLIQQALDQRRPGSNPFVTPRIEQDRVEFYSGIFEDKTLGTPIAFRILNQQQKSSDYKTFKNVLRPGHGDYTYFKKYGHRDYRGGGRASARETAARVVGGAIAKQILDFKLGSPVTIRCCIVQIGSVSIQCSLNELDWDEAKQNPFSCPCSKTASLWQDLLNQAKEKGTSLGANFYLDIQGIPAGLGEPVFDKLDADLAKAMMSINAVKAVAIGDTFNVAEKAKGFDEMHMNEKGQVTFASNHAGGILAGISSGQPIQVMISFKPTSSTLESRSAITTDGQNTRVQIHGRHDPCVALRAGPIINAMAALTLADHLLRFQGQCSLG